MTNVSLLTHSSYNEYQLGSPPAIYRLRPERTDGRVCDVMAEIPAYTPGRLLDAGSRPSVYVG